MEDRGKMVELARIADQAERYDDMVSHMEALSKLPDELTSAERNMLVKAYKNAAGKRRSAWQVMCRAEEEDRAKGNGEHAGYAREYREKLEAELEALCGSFLDLIGAHLLSRAAAADAQVFYKKSVADFLRYAAEFRRGAARLEAIEGARNAYEEAWAMSEEHLHKNHPFHLSLALNYSIFHHDFLNNPDLATQMAEHAVAEAIKDPHGVESKDQYDFDNNVRALRANVELWSPDKEASSWGIMGSVARSFAGLFF